VSQTVFDFGKLNLFEYSGTKILLENNTSEVIKCDENEEGRRYTTRILSQDNTISLKNSSYDFDLNDEKFDNILSFETMKKKKYFINMINEFYPKLKKDGKFFIAVFNKSLLKNPSSNKLDDATGVSFNEFDNILKNQFKSYDIFSQKLLSENEIEQIKKMDKLEFESELPIKSKSQNKSTLKKIRENLAYCMRMVDKSGNIYSKIFSGVIKKLDTKLDQEKIRFQYMPILHEKHHVPMFFIAICTK